MPFWPRRRVSSCPTAAAVAANEPPSGRRRSTRTSSRSEEGKNCCGDHREACQRHGKCGDREPDHPPPSVDAPAHCPAASLGRSAYRRRRVPRWGPAWGSNMAPRYGTNSTATNQDRTSVRPTTRKMSRVYSPVDDWARPIGKYPARGHQRSRQHRKRCGCIGKAAGAHPVPSPVPASPSSFRRR